MKTQLSLEEYTDTVLSEVASYEQDAILSYPSVADYKKGMANLMNVILSGDKGITVVCDFDADGIFSGVILWSYLRNAYNVLRGEGSDEMAKIIYTDRQNSFGMTKDEFDIHSKTSDLIVTVDNGSDLPFLSDDLDGKLLVLDHHPSKNRYSYILNPNTGREEGSEFYSTSGGRVTYDFCQNVHKAFIHHSQTYRDNFDNKDSDRMFETLKVLAGFTLVSDMAVLDSNNRNFLLGCLETIRKDPERLHFFSQLKDITTRNFSFDVITLVNAMSRMDQDLSIMTDWIAIADRGEWEKINEKLLSNNELKKEIVREATRKIFQNMDSTREKERKVEHFFLPDQPIGILGLIANKVAQTLNKKPVITLGVKNDGNIAISARGTMVKTHLTAVVENSGGHPDACGGSIKVSSSPQEEYEKFSARLEEHCKQNPHLFSDTYPMEVFSLEPVSVNEFIKIREMFMDKSEGVDFYKRINIPVSDFTVIGGAVNTNLSKKGWGSLFIHDSAIKEPKQENIISFWVDSGQYELSMFDRSDAVIVFEATVNGDVSIVSCTNKDTFKKSSILIEEADELSISFESELSEREEISDKPTLDGTPFVMTENPKVFLTKRYTVDLVQKYPDFCFVFGDNMAGKGRAGQAVVRGYENTVGVPTKRLPSMTEGSFFSDKKEEQSAIIGALEKVSEKLSQGYNIVFPEDGLGTGLAKMNEGSPELFRIMNEIIGKNFTKEYLKFNDKNFIPSNTPRKKEHLLKTGYNGNKRQKP